MISFNSNASGWSLWRLFSFPLFRIFLTVRLKITLKKFNKQSFVLYWIGLKWHSEKMQSIQRFGFPKNRFYGVLRSQRPPASVRVKRLIFCTYEIAVFRSCLTSQWRGGQSPILRSKHQFFPKAKETPSSTFAKT